MVSISDLPYAVSRSMTTAQIDGIVDGSIPNGTIINNIDNGQVVIIQGGKPHYLPYLTDVPVPPSNFKVYTVWL